MPGTIETMPYIGVSAFLYAHTLSRDSTSFLLNCLCAGRYRYWAPQTAIDNHRALQQQLDALEAAASMHRILIFALILSLVSSSSRLSVLIILQATGNIRM